MAQGYEIRNDTFMRLDNTICMYKGYPYYITVHDVDYDEPEPDVNEVKGYNLLVPDARYNPYETIMVTDDDFDFRVPRLGYVNYINEALWVTRKPERRQKAAIHRNTLNINSDRHNVNSVMQSDFFGEMILDIYPTMAEAIKICEEGVDSWAFDKDMCVRWSDATRALMFLCYKGRDIGYRPLHGNWHLFDTREASFYVNVINNKKIEGLEL